MSNQTSQHFKLDISQIKRLLPFIEGKGIIYKANQLQLNSDIEVFYTGKSLLLHYQLSQEYIYHISLTQSDCHLGGQRIRLKCPISTCKRPVAALFLKDEIFACRTCHQLIYPSQLRDKFSLLMFKLEKLEKTLKGKGSKGVPPLRPKGMHQKTYQRLCAKYIQTYYEILKQGEKNITNRSQKEFV